MGMLVNFGKSTISCEGIKEDEVHYFLSLFPFRKV
jgi:hypothetical protein